MLTPIEIGTKIAEARKAKNLSQALLAQKLSLSPQAVGKWERGESMPDILTLNRLAKTLNVDLNYFSEDFPPASAPAAQASGPLTAPAVPHADPPLVPSPDMIRPDSARKKPGWNMSEGSWVGADFSGLKDLHDKFGASFIRDCLFVGSQLSGLLLDSNHAERCDFTDADLGGSRIRNSHLAGDLFLRSSLREASITGSHVKDCDFSGADFTDATIESSQLQNCALGGVVWDRTRFSRSQLTGLVLEGAFGGCSFENCSFKDVVFQNATFTETFFKNKSLKKIRFIDCKADRLTYSFLKNGKADMSQIALFTP
ncbi:helix-turn-helix domain-containing protein [Saccharibacillus alkalitolerans]|uniref:Helix-turn-helix domain-containing protein n=1 Tax=Saccharibacillus alkalitolerans TaxID=2705290 RepID=A0ABX0F9E1_9BACL|nr:pentapeptide repeat-containing protein [Saccharibacillus alkalitolerans]NGZ76639.1 helix-turn-helix domain-containing protein [Saccharibacillus alkalitolerans]